MRKSRHIVIWLAVALMLQGCVGFGAWTLGSRSEPNAHPKIGQRKGATDVRTGQSANQSEGTLKTAAELRAQWGEPDRIESGEPGTEEWIYKTDGLRWSGLVLYVVIIPLPAMIPVGSQYVSLLIHDGHIESATRTDWAFKAGAYCGFFGMMYGGWGCGTGTFEEEKNPENLQSLSPGPSSKQGRM